MNIAEVMAEIENRKKTGDLIKKRFTCIHCGKTWIEFVGVVVGHKDGLEDMYLRVGAESENCFACKWRALKCENCSANDIYEVTFPKEIQEGTPLSFKSIKKVANHRANTASLEV
ncbi:MAG: hypothetical protein CW716_05270 [Candidatus Bathyarchaeum sp.]|nr:MAG: hypothetical protein CW716_05270 [Candidatus Bathyarchaeum sp.]